MDQLLTKVSRAIISDPHLRQKEKALISIKISEVERALIDGADELVQFLALMFFAVDTINKP